ncbi:outer membrane protein assembly factor BamA [Micavibrio aeruginosavorus]|uniref:Outer membrane protein assembly factor BamA n=1 Tax=Micavibrio aeruginosavorus EPB TaxID=349215 RepID=M4VJ58_9BACT|nr:Outer membrane protein assembly factor YaeT precursor [Micavibrio aeruginosavorus EPB]
MNMIRVKGLGLLAIAGLCAFSILAVPTTVSAQGYASEQATGTKIKDIEVLGTQRIEPVTVLTYLDAKVGDPMTQDLLDGALKSLFGTGLFADVTLRQKGSTLEVTVVENPVISEIAFEGNDKLKDEDLLAEISLRPRQVFTRTKVQSDLNRLYQVYTRSGRFSAQIDPKVIELDQNRVNLVFEIDEGPVTKVKGIRFVGNEVYDDDTLRSEISTKEDRWYRFLGADDRYDPDRLSYDQELLRRFYLSQGYADFRILASNAELSKDKDAFYLTFTVEEGPRYRVGNVTIDANLRDFNEADLVPFLTFKPGDWYNADEVERTVDAFTRELGNRQFAFVDVKPGVERNREKRTVDLTFNIRETPKVFVERIDIRGNVRTLDKVIRREMDLVEGDPFNREKVAKSEQKIRDLGYFENVIVTPQPGTAPDKSVVDIEVAEKSTGELSIGAGFSTADGPLADFKIRERNFLGKGQDLLLGATIAGERTEFDFAFTEPYFLDRDFSAGVNAFHITRDLQDESSYDQKRTGGGFEFGYPLSEKWRQSLRYRVEQNEITEVQDDASRYIKEQAGERSTSAIGQMLTYDSRNSTLFPSDGTYGWLDTEMSGLGGDSQYISAKLGASHFYPLFDTDRVVLNVLGEVGAIHGYGDENVAINERFFLGGGTLRGFEPAGVGPRDIGTDDSLGGNMFYRGSVELSFPVGLPDEMGIKGHAFTDFGSLWEIDDVGSDVEDINSLRAGAGVGVSWRSPIGPVRVDFSAPFMKEDFDKEENFRFSFGTRF